jgi:spore germination protein YaaH
MASSSTLKRTTLALLALLALAGGASSNTLGFAEVWAYLMSGEEAYAKPSYPITDIGYFGAGLSSYGKLVGLPKRDKIKALSGRVHLVVSQIDNSALTHFCLDPAYPLRDALVADIIAASADFDGVQIDFETVPPKDYDAFYEFVSLLKAGLGSKTLSVALPACTAEKYDRFGYERIAKVADRVIVMAYDEHWSSSAPGPVASIDWCRKVSAYALSKVGEGKLVMGAPFYGRAWADKSPSRAYKYSSLASLIAEKEIGLIQREGDIPFVEYVETVNVKAFFDDAASILARLGMYSSSSVRNVAFWRLGQEDPGVWDSIAVAAPSAEAPTARPAAWRKAFAIPE